MTSLTILTALVLAVAAGSLTACGSRSKQTTTVQATTTGQELQDLQKALDDGLITQKEYDKKRKDVLSR